MISSEVSGLVIDQAEATDEEKWWDRFEARLAQRVGLSAEDARGVGREANSMADLGYTLTDSPEEEADEEASNWTNDE